MYQKHPYEERVLAVLKCLNGESPKSVARQLGVCRHMLYEWLIRYERDGAKGLQKQPNKRATYAEKCKIVCEFAEKHVPLHRVSADYNVSQTTILSWTRIYRKGGYEALNTIKAPGNGRKGIMGRPKKQEPLTELERLRRENEWLRAEVALLKKVRALMVEKECQQQEIGRKPSKH